MPTTCASSIRRKSSRIPDLIPDLSRLTDERPALIRSQSRVRPGARSAPPQPSSDWRVMVDDPDADTRYNAAVGLAHHGNAKAVETLAEMLDLGRAGKRAPDSQRARPALQAAP